MRVSGLSRGREPAWLREAVSGRLGQDWARDTPAAGSESRPGHATLRARVSLDPFSEWTALAPGWDVAKITRGGVSCSRCDREFDVTDRIYRPTQGWNKGYCEECARKEGAPIPST